MYYRALLECISLSNVLLYTSGITVLFLFQFGCFSVYCSDESGTVLQNEVVGPLVRTKLAGENEGGVVVGIAAIDSPYFV